MRQLIHTALLLCAVCLAPQAAAQTSVKFDAFITQYGLFDLFGDQNDTAAPNTAAGKVSDHDSSRLVETTTTVKARKGVVFGFKYEIRGLRDGEHSGFEMRVTHPPMKGPDGRVSTLSQAPTFIDSQAGVAGNDLLYKLSQDFEVLPGQWTLEALYQGRVVLSKTFVLQ
jgi:Domain of unknown function (DUF3859)